jgi:type 1 glutamine amidotransferase
MRFAMIVAAAAVAGAAAAFVPAGLVASQGDNVVEKIDKALPAKAPAEPKQRRKILIFSRTAGFRHGSIPTGIKAITMMGEKTGAYLAVATEDEAMFEPEKLKAFDAVFMLNTTGDCLKPKGNDKDDIAKREEVYKQSLKAFVESGKGLIGVHSATDTYHNWKDYNVMMGGTFQSHPWGEGSKVAIKNLDPKHPINAAFDGKGFEIMDEIYMFKPGTALGTERHFLLALDEKKMDVTKGKRKDDFYAISWVATYGKGRNFYCSLGHRPDIYWNPMVLQHYLAGIQYALGDLEADATPSEKAK